MKRLIEGVAFNSGGKHKVSIGGVAVRSYVAWRHMIGRCYCPKTQKKQPTYIGCSVTDEWLDYQVFAEWFCEQEHSDIGYDLDKDLLVVGNKVYSPETCSFIPRELNSILTDCKAARTNLPQGVSFDKRCGKYQSRVNLNVGRKSLGYFDCPSDAYKAYKDAKEAYVKERALHWKDRIDPRVFDAIMDWRLSYSASMPE